MNEKVLTVIFLLVTVAAIVFFGFAEMALPEIITMKLVYITTLLVSGLGLLHFMHGTKFDVSHEIFEEQNIAAAIFVSGFLISLAMVIAK